MNDYDNYSIHQPSTEDVNAMKKVLEAFSNSEKGITAPTKSQDTHKYTSTSNEEVSAMKQVLAAFSAAGEQVILESNDETMYDQDTRDLVNTALTGRVKIGNIFEIKIREIESLKGMKKVYDIINTSNNEVITNDLFLYEAAYAIVKYLNKGYNVLSNEIRQVVKLEQDYASARTDAGMFRIRIQENIKKSEVQKASIYEARFQESRDKALRIKSELTKICDRL